MTRNSTRVVAALRTLVLSSIATALFFLPAPWRADILTGLVG